MEYTEEVKKEADSVIKLIDDLNSQELDAYLTEKDCIKLAIQDRQSVLELAKRLRSNSMSASSLIINHEIQSLTQQIEYLKSKL